MTIPPFTLRQLSTGDLCIDGDCGLPPLAEARHRLDVDGDMPKLADACGISAGDVVIDVGAFVGDTAQEHLRRSAKVYAIEPFADAFTCLMFNTRAYREQVWCLNAAAGNGEWVKLVYQCPGPNLGMRSVIPADDSDPEKMRALRIDDLELESCKLMKIDCEGSEIPTLHGAAETIRRCKPFLYVEMYADGLAHRGYTPQQLVDTIHTLGYEVEMWGSPPRWDWFCRPI